MLNEKPKKGNLIIADANILNDHNFNRSVILLTEFNSSGSLGFILNKKINIKLNDIIENTKCDFSIYYGGPVEPENLYFIHNKPDIVINSIEISNGIYWGGDFKTILQLIDENKLHKNNIRFFLGYTGWDLNQLENEITEYSWLIKENIYKNNILKETPSKLWKELMKTFGNEQIIWCNAPEDPVQN